MKIVENIESHLNRIVIAGLTQTSLFAEGWVSDVLMMLAVLVWLWLPELQHLMKTGWKQVKISLFWLRH